MPVEDLSSELPSIPVAVVAESETNSSQFFNKTATSDNLLGNSFLL
jgi:hypothetical protein